MVKNSLFDLVKILMVDDSQGMRDLLRGMLKQIGFKHILEAPEVYSALKILESHTKIDIILSDWTMPHKTGYDFLREVRTISGYERVPFIMITSNTDIDDIQRASLAGVCDYILKPLSTAILEEKICSALGIPVKEY